MTALKKDFVLQARGFCTDYSLPVSSSAAVLSEYSTCSACCLPEHGSTMDIITNLRAVLLVVQFVLDFFCAKIRIYMKVEMTFAVELTT